jgi:hypothetical protein
MSPQKGMGDGTETMMIVMSVCLVTLGVLGFIAYYFLWTPSCTAVDECPDPGMYEKQDFGMFLFDLARIFRESSVDSVKEEDIRNRFMFSYMKGMRCCYRGMCLIMRLPRLDEILFWVNRQKNVLKEDNVGEWFDSKTRTVTFPFPLEDTRGKVYYTVESFQIPDVNPTDSDIDSLGIPRESFIKSVIPKFVWNIRDPETGQVTSTSLDVSAADIIKLSQIVIEVYSQIFVIVLSQFSLDISLFSSPPRTDPVKYQSPLPSPSRSQKKPSKNKKKKKKKKS